MDADQSSEVFPGQESVPKWRESKTFVFNSETSPLAAGGGYLGPGGVGGGQELRLAVTGQLKLCSPSQHMPRNPVS